MNKLRFHGFASGTILITMGIIAGYCLGYRLQEFYHTTPKQLSDNLNMYKIVLMGLTATIVLDYIVCYTLYRFFEKTDKKQAQISSYIRFTYSLIFSWAAVFLFKNLDAVNLSNDEIQYNYSMFQTVWSAGLMLFGLHIVVLGFLAKKHRKIPTLLWMSTLIAGLSYTLVSFLKLIDPLSEIVALIEISLALPMAFGELGLAFWLITKGGEDKFINHQEPLLE